MLKNNTLSCLGLLFYLFLNFASLPALSQSLNDAVRFDNDLAPASSTGSFAKDTILITEYNRLARKFLYHDAVLSINFAKKALSLAQTSNWEKGKLITYNLLSTFYLIDGGFDILREISNESYNLAIKIKLPLYRASAEQYLGESYSEYKEWDKAEKYFDSAMKTFVELKNDSARAVCLESIGNFYREKNEPDKAIEYYEQAFKLNEKLGNTFRMGSVINAKGYLYVRGGIYYKAEELFLQALKLYESIGNRYGMLNVWNDLSNVHLKTQEFDRSIEESKIALDLANKYHSPQHINWALTCLANSYKKKNNLQETVKYLEQINFNRRLMHEERIERQFTMSQLIFDNKRMDSEIQENIIKKQRSIQIFLVGILFIILFFSLFLWHANYKLRKMNTEIKTALFRGQTIERKRVAAELHDNLGGTLASLNWYLYGIDKKILPTDERLIYEDVQNMVSKAYRELRSLSHNLMPDELEKYGLVETISNLIEKLNFNNTIKFSLTVEGLEERLDGKVEFELYSILLELTNNILKHSKASEAGISIIKTTKKLEVIVSDNGKGLTLSDKNGIGLKNVKSRIESLSGELAILKGKGTKINICIPANVKL